MSNIPSSLTKKKKQLLDNASPRRATAISAIFDVCSSMLDEGLHISVVSVGERTSQIKGGPTARTIYNTTDPYGNLVQDFVDVQSSQKPGEILSNQTDFELPSLEEVIEGISDPKHKAALREFEHNSIKTRDRMRILEGFISKVTAKQVSQLTNPQSNTPPQRKIEDTPVNNGTALLSRDEQDILTNFIEETLFDEGYEMHDGDIFHTTSGRSLRTEKFVQLIQKLTEAKT